mmetsp:Transcript_10013/g.21414  ORF Transcript_10013/g.21414 Transcript_10013/m.21414 type:complete len:280 (+) Transcript_10013:108-947(+)
MSSRQRRRSDGCRGLTAVFVLAALFSATSIYWHVHTSLSRSQLQNHERAYLDLGIDTASSKHIEKISPPSLLLSTREPQRRTVEHNVGKKCTCVSAELCRVISSYSADTNSSSPFEVLQADALRSQHDGGISYLAVDASGPSDGSVRLAPGQGLRGWSLEAWVQLHVPSTIGQPSPEFTILAAGPYKLALRKPNEPVLRVEPDQNSAAVDYSVHRNMRGHCADYTFRDMKVSGIEEATLICATTPGQYPYPEWTVTALLALFLMHSFCYRLCRPDHGRE